MTENYESQRRIAVFLDVENLAIHAEQQGLAFRVAPIIHRACKEGRVTVARAYGDFSRPFMTRVLADLQRSVFALGQLPTDAKGKKHCGHGPGQGCAGDVPPAFEA